MRYVSPAALAPASASPTGSRRFSVRCVAASAAVTASQCGASSPVIQPAKKAGMPARKPGRGRIALAVSAAYRTERRRNDTDQGYRRVT